jgi:hypothetical protein
LGRLTGFSKKIPGKAHQNFPLCGAADVGV